MDRVFFILGSLSGGMAVALGAFAAHGLRWLGALTPLGGVAFVAGWICLALAAWRG